MLVLSPAARTEQLAWYDDQGDGNADDNECHHQQNYRETNHELEEKEREL
jgi:hypothetical protein